MRSKPPPRTGQRSASDPPARKPGGPNTLRHAGALSGPGPDRAPPKPQFRPARGTAPEARRPAAPGGGVWLYGLHAVGAALANPNRRLRRLMLTEEAEAAIPGKPWPLQPERTDRARLDQLLGRDVVHQGVAVLADPLAPPALAQVVERARARRGGGGGAAPPPPGAMLRSAAAFGAAGVVAQDRNAPDETGALAKAASGALETMPLLRAVNLARTLVALKAAGFWTVGLAANAPPLSGAALAGRRIALVLGAEGSGLRRLTRDTCDELAGLAMPGNMESLNVSAAASIALYELNRRG